MKNLKTAIIATIVTVLIICSCAYAMPATAEDANVYSKPAIVTGYDLLKDLVTVVDDEGNVWEFYGAEGLAICDIVWLTIYSYGTKTMEDDEIIDVVWEGTCTLNFLAWWLGC